MCVMSAPRGPRPPETTRIFCTRSSHNSKHLKLENKHPNSQKPLHQSATTENHQHQTMKILLTPFLLTSMSFVVAASQDNGGAQTRHLRSNATNQTIPLDRLSNKCDICNTCACDENCDCVGPNKCDICKTCKCDNNCDCLAPALPAYPTEITCVGDGGACGCGRGGDGKLITLNRFFGDDSDQQVWGCGGAFSLNGGTWGAEWAATTTGTSAGTKAGMDFSQQVSYDGWEGCCFICGANLQLAGKLSSGWYCEKDFFSTGIWLKGKNKGQEEEQIVSLSN